MSICVGCKKQCEYGYVQLSYGGYLPKLGSVFITAYVDANNKHVILRPKEMTPNIAMAEAEKIAKLCEYRKGRDFSSMVCKANQKSK